MVHPRRDNIHATEGATGGLPASAFKTSPHRRRGSIYAAVLGCSLAVTVIGLSALLALRVERRFAEGTGDFSQARLYAYSAIEDGLFRIQSDPDWRNTYPNGAWKSDAPIGTGTYTLIGEDLFDSDLTDSDSDSVLLTGIGVQGDARYKLQVTLTAEVQALTCLEVAWHANNDILFESTSQITCDQTISANNTVQTSSPASVYADVEAVNAITGTGYYQKTTTGIAPRTLPDAATVFDYYLTNGTAINIDALPSLAGASLLEDVVLSPASNPFGPTDPQGIYVIDCSDRVIKILNLRIVGTLVLLDPGVASMVQNAIHWEPALDNYPALLVRGDFKFGYSSTSTLDESFLHVNFNPPGTPYESQEDSLQDDSYPSLIRGLIYVSNDIQAAMTPRFDGVVISGNTSSQQGDVSLTYQQVYLTDPSPGFGSTAGMVISPGSWRQVVD